MINFIEYVVAELKGKKLSKTDAISLINQFSNNSSNTAKEAILHPLLHRNTSDFSQQSYRSLFSSEEFFLKDHQVQDQRVLPGVVYLEMARSAIENALPYKKESTILELQNIVWPQPIIVTNKKEVSIAVFANEEEIYKGQIDYEIYSNDEIAGEQVQEIIHCQGQAIFAPQPATIKLNVQQLQAQIGKERIEASVLYEIFRKLGLNFGPAHKAITAIYKGNGQILAQLNLPAAVEQTFNDYFLHPSLMDGALQSVLGLIVDFDNIPENPTQSLPLAVESLQILSACTKEMFAWIRYSEGSKLGDRLMKVDIDLCDQEGNTCVRFKGFSSKVIATKQLETSSHEEITGTLITVPAWEASPIAETSEENKTEYSQKHIILCDIPKVSGKEIQLLIPGSQSITLNSPTLKNIAERYNKVSLACFEQIQKILKDKPIGKVLIQIVIGNTPEEKLYTGLLGLIKTATLENPQLVGQIILTQKQSKAEELANQLKAEQNQPNDTLIKYELDKRYIHGHKQIEAQQDKPQIAFKDKGVYLITGGLGGLGTLFAKEILKQTTKAKIILTGRSELTTEKQNILKGLTSGAKNIVYQQLDISDLEQVKQFVASLIEQNKQLNGIIHSAGMISDNFILKKSASEFAQVTEPKVTGTFNLDEATKDIELDFFMLFSSSVSMIGNVGQADYAVANGFMDQFAIYRNQLVTNENRIGKTLSINWPLWQEGGMEVGQANKELLKQSSGMYPMQSQTGVNAFYQGLASEHDQIMVAEGDLSKLHQVILSGQTPQQPAPPVVKKEEQSPISKIDPKNLEEKTKEYLRKELSAQLKLPAHRIDPNAPLEKYGIDSILAMDLTNQLEKTFGSLSKTLFFEYRTIHELAQYFIKNYSDKLAGLFTLPSINKKKTDPNLPVLKAEVKPKLPNKIRSNRRLNRQHIPLTLNTNTTKESDPIAIVGLSGRYPEANNIQEFWDNLQAGKDCIVEVPKERWDWREYYSEDRSKKGHHYSKWGGFINGVDEFDPRFFNISPREAKLIDPQERLFLQHSWMAIEDAGYTRDTLQIANDKDMPGQVGVYVGVMYGEYQMYGVEESAKGNRMGIGGSYASIANRVSYILNLHGPSMTLDTMCSSSLTAIHLACQDLRQGNTNLAIAGGVNVSIHPNKYLVISAGQFISSDGHCQSFGEGGDGYIPGEGVGAVVLKRLSEAVKDGNHIYGVIKSSVINHGGKTNGYSVPNPQAQASVITRALEEANIESRQISYLEAHGTGTKLGDPIEINSLSRAFQKHTQDTGFCKIGSAKSNIGHGESAAGIAGLTKVLLQMKYKQIVPSLHSKVLNPYIDFEKTPFIVNQTLIPWEQPIIDGKVQPRIAGLSSFGAGGSNAHMIIEEYESPVETQTEKSIQQGKEFIIVLSARKEEQLKQKVVELYNFIRTSMSDEHSLWAQNPMGLASVAYTLQVGREAMDKRLGFIVDSIEQLQDKLHACINDNPDIEGFYKSEESHSKAFISSFSDDSDFQETISRWIARNKLSKLLDLWVNGMDLDWNKLYTDVTPQKISLPVYPFAKEKYWVDVSKNEKTPKASTINAVLHPLLHTNTSDLNQQSFSTTFSGEEFFLTDHQINTNNGSGKKVLPASAYVEMIRVAVQQASNPKQESSILELGKIHWGQPAIVDKNKTVTIALFAEDNGHVEFEIFSKVNDAEIVHSLGYAVYSAQPKPATINIERLKEQIGQDRIEPAKLYSDLSLMGLHYGPTYQGITSIIKDKQQLLAELRLPTSLEASKNDFVLHPSIIDGAVQAAICLLTGNTQHQRSPFLPVALESLRVIFACTQEMFAWVRTTQVPGTEGTTTQLDIDLCDKKGHVCVQFRGLSLQQVAYGETQQVANKIAKPVNTYVPPTTVTNKPQAVQLSGTFETSSVAVGRATEKPQAIQLLAPQEVEALGAGSFIPKPQLVSLNSSPEIDFIENTVTTKPQAIELGSSQKIDDLASNVYNKPTTLAFAEPTQATIPSKERKSTYTKEHLQKTLISTLAEALYLQPSEIETDKSFIDLGLDSIVGVEWVKAINKEFGLDISSTKIYDYSTIKELVVFLAKELENTPMPSVEEMTTTTERQNELISNPANEVVVELEEPAPSTNVSLQALTAPPDTLSIIEPTQQPTKHYTKEHIQKTLISTLAEALYLQTSEIETEKPFIDLGLDSIVGVEWVKAINKEFGLDISSTKIYDYSTIKELVVFLAKELENTPMPSVEEVTTTTESQNMQVNSQPKEMVVEHEQPVPSVTLPKTQAQQPNQSNHPTRHYTKEHLQKTLISTLAEALYLQPSEIETEKPFIDLGLDSIVGVEWVKAINKEFGLDISSTKIYDYSTIKELVVFLAKELENTPMPSVEEVTTTTGSQNMQVNSEPKEMVVEHELPVPAVTLPKTQAQQPNQSNHPTRHYTKEHLQKTLISTLAEALYLQPSEIETEKPFIDLGLDSIVGVEWVKAINKELGLDISSTKIYDYSTIKELVVFLAEELGNTEGVAIKEELPASPPITPPPAAKNPTLMLSALPNLKRKVRNRKVEPSTEEVYEEKIAIIGMSGRYPDASNLEQYWENLAQGKNSVTEIPLSRWDMDQYFDPDPTKQGKMYSKWLGMLDDVDCFDPLFFQIPPSEAEVMDPQHRLFLQESYKAFEDAGYSNQTLNAKKCGVYLGIMSNDYSFLLSRSNNKSLNITGNSYSIGAARIAYFLNLKGPAIPIDTACSSSLVALHVACQALLNNEVEMALTGGVSLYLAPESYLGMCQAGMLSPEGQCKTFDDSADGFVPGEGVGTLILKRLKDAERDNDFIHGVILGSGINQDGKTNGITAPSVNSQIEVEREIYSRYKIDPETISYVEAHGTGTKLGDPIELEALSSVFKEKTSKKNYCALGSVKTNIGHSSGAAGVASVQKVLLSMKNKTLVPSLNIKKENTIFDFKNSPFYISKEKKPWDVSSGTLRRASISSFGYSGTNAHLVIEEYPQQQRHDITVNTHNTGVIIPLSARTEVQLKQKAQDLLEHIRKNEQSIDLIAMAYTLQVGRNEMRERLGFVVNTVSQLSEKLQAYNEGKQNIEGAFTGKVARDKETLSILGTEDELQRMVEKWISDKNSSKLLELWVKGLEFDWNKLYGENKPQHMSLPTYPFAKDRYWVDLPTNSPSIGQEIAGETKVEPSPKAEEKIQKMYYSPSWKEAALSVQPESNKETLLEGPILLIDTTDELYRAMKERLAGTKDENSLVFVKLEKSYQEKDANHYTINPQQEEHFYQLVESLNTKNKLPRQIIHQGASPLPIEKKEQMEQQLNYGLYTLFGLNKALMKQKSQGAFKIISLYSDSSITAAPQNAALGAFFKTLTLENPKCQAKLLGIHWDIKQTETTHTETIRIILDEFSEKNWDKDEIRYKFQGEKKTHTRYVKEILPFNTANSKISDLPIKQNGVYIVSGGLGGLGLIFSEYLAKNFQCKLVLLGRSKLNEEKEAKLNQLKTLNKNILYVQADVAKLEDVEWVVKTTKEQFSQINGIIHSAGINNDSFILKKSKEEMAKVLEPKMLGATHLDQATKSEDLDLFITFSSLAGVMGNLGQCDYAYANHFLDAFAENRTQMANEQLRFGATLSINWPYWAEGGMSLTGEEIALSKKQTGICPMPTEAGIQYFEEFLKSGLSQGIPFYGLQSKIKANLLNEPVNIDNKQTTQNNAFDDTNLLEKTETYLKSLIGDEIKLAPEQIDSQELFEAFGIDSIIINRINVKLEKDFGALSKTLFYEYSSIEELAGYLVKEARQALVQFFNLEDSAKESLVQVEEEKEEEPQDAVQEKNTVDDYEPIAIIGVHGHYPKSDNLNKYWENLKKGKDLVDLVPESRWNYEEYYDEDPEKVSEGKIYCKWGGFINDVDKFDPQFFNITPEEAKIIDPQERIFLQSVWASIEDAGYTKESLKKQHPKAKSADVGVFVGVTTNTYNLLATDEWNRGNFVDSSALPWSIANRVSYTFDFQGPSMPIDTACSSSLVAIHLACESLRKQECQVAVAGGVNLYLHPSKYHSLCKKRMVSLGGKCRSFGAGDDGFVPGEGVGSVLLKPLSKAIADEDHIYALVSGSAVDHSGRANGYSAPNPNSQANLIDQTLKKAKIHPETIGYVEGHGTGTQLGDSLEIVALTNAFQKQTQKKQYCPVGSVKANVGHSESAAGIAGVAKILMQLKHKQLAPTIYSDEVNPNIEFKETPFYLQHKSAPWNPSPDYPRRALMNSFGAGGVNACVILEEYEKPKEAEATKSTGPYLVALSAKDEKRLNDYVNRLLTYIGKEKRVNLADLSYTLQVGREAMQERLVFVVSDRTELINQLKDWKQQKPSANIYQGKLDPRQGRKKPLKKEEEELLKTIFEAQDLAKLAEMWIAGKEVDWIKLYPQNKPKRMALPTYPFAKDSYWVSEIPIPENKAVSTQKNGQLHPLVSYNTSTLKEVSFTSILSDSEFYAQDHQVHKEKIFPGSGFLEIANISGNIAGEQKVSKIKDVVWAHPLSFKNGSQMVQTILRPNGKGTIYQITSLNDENERITHSEGRLFYKNGDNHSTEAEKTISINALKGKCEKTKDGVQFYDLFRKGGFNYGSAFQTIQELYLNDSFALSKLKIAEGLKSDFDQYILHPSLLDGALQTVAGLIGNSEPETPHLPFAIDEIEILRPMSHTCYAYVEFANAEKQQTDIKTFNVQLINKRGDVLAKLKNFYVRALEMV